MSNNEGNLKLFAVTYSWMNFLEEFLVGRELKFLSRQVHAHLVHDSCLAHSQMTKNTKKSGLILFTTLV
jgi:hypothetical protein